MQNGCCKLLGVDITVGTREELLAVCSALIGIGGAVSTVNPEILANSREDRALKRALGASVNIPDGVGVRMALRARGVMTDTLPGVELGEELLDIRPVRLGIVGGVSGVAEAAMENLLARHGTLSAAFAVSGYGKRYAEYREILKGSGADIVFVCMGSPKQELFIYEMRREFPSVLFVALGGSADVYSGKSSRAPLVFRRSGTEWLFRMLREPRRIRRLPSLIRFAGYALFEKNGKKPMQNGKRKLFFQKKSSEN